MKTNNIQLLVNMQFPHSRFVPSFYVHKQLNELVLYFVDESGPWIGYPKKILKICFL